MGIPDLARTISQSFEKHADPPSQNEKPQPEDKSVIDEFISAIKMLRKNNQFNSRLLDLIERCSVGFTYAHPSLTQSNLSQIGDFRRISDSIMKDRTLTIRALVEIYNLLDQEKHGNFRAFIQILIKASKMQEFKKWTNIVDDSK